MNTLQIALASIPDDGLMVDMEVPVSAIQPGGTEPLPADQVRVCGQLTPMTDGYLFQGRVSGVFVHPCDRCLENAELPFDLELAWPFEEGPPAALLDGDLAGSQMQDVDGDVLYTYQGHQIDLAPYVWEEVALAMPVKYICSEECAGLCPHCGANRNTGACRCEEDAGEPGTHSGLAGLAGLFPGLKPGEPKS